MLYSTKERAAVALKVIRTQFPETPEGALMFAVIAQAVEDATAKPQPKAQNHEQRNFQVRRLDAVEYLTGNLLHAQAAGVDPRWIQRIFKRYQLDFAVPA